LRVFLNMNLNQNPSKNRLYLLASFSLLFGWIMSLPYEGPVLFALAGEKGIDYLMLNTLTVFFHFAGLFSGIYLAKDNLTAKRNIVWCSFSALVLSLFIPFVSTAIWSALIPLASFLTGVAIASYAHLLKTFVTLQGRTRTVADILIFGNIVLIGAHIFANNTTPLASFILIEILLALAVVAAIKIDLEEKPLQETIVAPEQKTELKDYWVLFLFIFVITINSGIMFQVIYPYYGEFELLASIYTNIPYIVAIYLLSRMLKINKFYFLYIGLALWIVTFILFAVLDKSILGFFLIFSVMLFAAGIFDLFWWSVMANNFENVKNPSALFGLGLALNVLGVWVGGIIGNYFMSLGFGKEGLSYIGLIVVTAALLIVLPLNNKLSGFLEYNEFLVRFATLDGVNTSGFLEEARNSLTRREYEVFGLLIEGKSDTQICEELHISINTLKTHRRNIYKKLNVANRLELIKKISDD